MAREFQEISTDLADFVSKMTRSITQAQRELDNNAVEMLQELASSRTKIPFITNEVKEVKNSEGEVVDHEISSTRKDIETSLLDLGIRPTFYQFSETLIDVAIDLSVEEEIKSNSGSRSKKQRFMVNTKNVRSERRYNRKLKAYSKLSVKMVPVPMPAGISDLVSHVAVET